MRSPIHGLVGGVHGLMGRVNPNNYVHCICFISWKAFISLFLC